MRQSITFKPLGQNLELLYDIEDCSIVEINRVDNIFEFVYRKDDETRYLTLSSAGGHNKFSETEYRKFEVSDAPLSVELCRSSALRHYSGKEVPEKNNCYARPHKHSMYPLLRPKRGVL